MGKVNRYIIFSIHISNSMIDNSRKSCIEPRSQINRPSLTIFRFYCVNHMNYFECEVNKGWISCSFEGGDSTTCGRLPIFVPPNFNKSILSDNFTHAVSSTRSILRSTRKNNVFFNCYRKQIRKTCGYYRIRPLQQLPF